MLYTAFFISEFFNLSTFNLIHWISLIYQAEPLFTLLFLDMYVRRIMFTQGKFYLKKEENKGRQKILPVYPRSIVFFVKTNINSSIFSLTKARILRLFLLKKNQKYNYSDFLTSSISPFYAWMYKKYQYHHW